LRPGARERVVAVTHDPCASRGDMHVAKAFVIALAQAREGLVRGHRAAPGAKPARQLRQAVAEEPAIALDRFLVAVPRRGGVARAAHHHVAHHERSVNPRDGKLDLPTGPITAPAPKGRCQRVGRLRKESGADKGQTHGRDPPPHEFAAHSRPSKHLPDPGRPHSPEDAATTTIIPSVDCSFASDRSS